MYRFYAYTMTNRSSKLCAEATCRLEKLGL
jgi:hypothetical protein